MNKKPQKTFKENGKSCCQWLIRVTIATTHLRLPLSDSELNETETKTQIKAHMNNSCAKIKVYLKKIVL